ncbi:MAG TPA: PAS domain-containing protein, partial [Anaerolineales bacterium]|nr:PAS domain-containing protein [Anaerolineales bacterium]
MKDTKEFLQLANSMFNGLVQIDSDGWVVLWNTAAERITGYSSRQLVGKPFADKSPKHLSDDGKELQKDSAPLLMTIKDGRPREVFLSIQHADGYQIPVIIRTSPIKDEKGKIIGGVEIFTDNRHTIASFQNGQKTEDTVLIDPLT